MRRAAAVVLLTALAGCGSSSGSSQLRSWTIPRDPFIADVGRAPQPVGPKRTPVVAARPHPRAHPAPAPAAATTGAPAGGAPSDAEVRAELRQVYGGSGGGLARTVSLTGGGTAVAPPDAPNAVQAIVSAANQVAKLPYVYGGGHGRAGPEGIWVDSAYDCSGSVSFALASAGLIKSPMDSTSLSHWGRPGPGRWVTIYANAGHAFMEIGGARFDTVGLQQSGSRWQPAYRSVSGFVVRHPPGL